MTGANAQPAGSSEPPETTRAQGVRGVRAPLAAMVGVALAIVVAFVAGARAGSLVLAGTLAAAAAVRAVTPGGGPPGVAVRTRTFDVAVLLALAVSIAVLATTTTDV